MTARWQNVLESSSQAGTMRGDVAGEAGALAGIKIALVGPVPPPAGGMAAQTRALALLFSEQGADIEPITTNAAYWPAWVARLRGLRAVARLLPYLRQLWAGAGRNDVMHVVANSGWSWYLFAVPVLLVGALRRIPVIVDYHGGLAETFLRRHGWLAIWSFRLARVLVVPSGFLRDVFGRYGMEARVIANIVDLGRFGFREPAEETPAEPVIVVARNLESVYGVDTALRAFAEIASRFPRARLRVAGSGPERNALEALAKELGVAHVVEFTGMLDAQEMARLYRGAHVLLNASRADNMPIALLEAMACGVPVVTTNAGGIPYIVSDGHSGLLADVGDVVGLSEAMVRVLTDRALARRIAETAVESVRCYRREEIAPQWAHLYAAVAGGGRER